MSEIYSEEIRDLVDFMHKRNKESLPNIEKVLRLPIIRRELDNILNDLLPLTYN
jgi:hypothetical protein